MTKTHADQVWLSSYPRYLRFFGVFLLFFALLLGLLYGAALASSANASPPPQAWFIPFAGVLVVAGTALALIRAGVLLDGRRRVRERVHGWGPWVRRETAPLDDLIAIAIAPATVRESNGRMVTVVPIEGLAASRRIELVASPDFVDARQLAKRIALAFALPVNPSPSADGQPGPPDNLDLPAQVLEQPSPRERERPPDSPITVADREHGIAIHLPFRMSLLVGPLIFLLVPMCLWLFWWLPSGLAHQTPSIAMDVTVAAPALFIFWLGWMMYRALAVRGAFVCNIAVDPAGIHVQGRLVQADRIRALEIVTSNREGELHLVTDDRESSIALSARLDDLRWIRALLLHHLATPTTLATGVPPATPSEAPSAPLVSVPIRADLPLTPDASAATRVSAIGSAILAWFFIATGTFLIAFSVIAAGIQLKRVLAHHPLPAVIIGQHLVPELRSDGTTRFRPRLDFTLTVDGRTVTGHDITMIPQMGDRPAMQSILDAYPIGSHVTAWYDPSNPDDVYIDHQPYLFPEIFMALFAMLIAAAGLFRTTASVAVRIRRLFVFAVTWIVLTLFWAVDFWLLGGTFDTFDIIATLVFLAIGVGLLTIWRSIRSAIAP